MSKEFHFVLNEKSNEKLLILKEKLKIKSMSKTIIMIVEQMLPYIEKHEISFEDKKSRYQYVGDEEEYRKHIHAYMPEALYKRLKKIHHDINYYSMAQFLRKIMEVYLKDCSVMGIEEHKAMLEKIRNRWDAEKRWFLAEGKKYIRQLSIKVQPAPVVTVTYDDLFLPMTIQRHCL